MPIKSQLFNSVMGMNMDAAPSKRNPKLAYQIKNMRVTIENDSSLMAWTNEKGTQKVNLIDRKVYKETGRLKTYNITGEVVGTCLLNELLILFVRTVKRTATTNEVDRIYYIDFSNEVNPMACLLYEGNLGFTDKTKDGKDVKFETLGVYENELIQKVYWIDGVNQPRYINIVNYLDVETVSDSITLFDFIPTDDTNLKVEITKEFQTGYFKAGTILYAFNYYNQSGALTNLVYLSPIQYVAPQTRGLETDTRVNCAFKLTCHNINTQFEFLRVYSISRTSQDTVPEARIVIDIPTDSLSTETKLIGYTTEYSTEPVYENVLEGEAFEPFTEAQTYARERYWYMLSKTESYPSILQDIEVYYEEYEPNSYKKSALINTFTEEEEPNGQGEKWIICPQGALVRFKSSDLFFKAINSTDRLVVGNLEEGTLSLTVSALNEANEFAPFYIYRNGTIVAAMKQVHVSDREVAIPVPITLDIALFTYTDNGEGGEAIDFQELLFLNNSPIIPYTLEQKDNTLFFGNFRYDNINDLLLKELFEDILAKDVISFKLVPLLSDNAIQEYPYTNQLVYSLDKIAGFKGGETYVFGFSLLNTQDKWTSIIPLQGPIKNTLYPLSTLDTQGNSLDITIVQAVVSSDFLELLKTRLSGIYDYKAVKFVMVSPDEGQRSVLCQGLVAPTVFCSELRYFKLAPFAQSSWFFRPTMKHNPTYYLLNGAVADVKDNLGSVLEFRHFASLSYSTPVSTKTTAGIRTDYTKEILVGNGLFESVGYTSLLYDKSIAESKGKDVDYLLQTSRCLYGVDNSIVTLHSPDIEFNSGVQEILTDNNVYKFRIIGYTTVLHTFSDTEIITDNDSVMGKKGDNIILRSTLVNIGKKANSTLFNPVPAAGTNYWYGAYAKASDYIYLIGSSGKVEYGNLARYFRVYPWNRHESVTTQRELTEDNPWLATIKTKALSNLRVCGKTKLGSSYAWRPVLDEAERGCSRIIMWGEESKYERLVDYSCPYARDFTYYGNVDTVISPDMEMGYIVDCYNNSGIAHRTVNADSNFYSSLVTLLALMKYNSSAHAVFSFGYNNFVRAGINKYQQWILPRINDSANSGDVIIPEKYSADDNNKNVIWYDSSVQVGSVIKSVNMTVDLNHLDFAMGVNVATSGAIVCLKAMGWGEVNDMAHDYTNDVEILDCNGNPTTETEFEYEFYLTVIYNSNGSTNTSDYKVFYYHNKHLLDEDLAGNQTWDNDYECISKSDYYPVGTILTSNSGSGYSWKIVSATKVQRIIDSESSTPDASYNYGSAIGNENKPYAQTDYRVDANDDGVFFIGELYLDSRLSTDNSLLMSYNWLVCSDTISLKYTVNDDLSLFGDTYFQRYDCLKTYPVSDEDYNQIVDIASFMVETRVNIDGRYDRNRGLVSNIDVSPTTFNMINKAYTQPDRTSLGYISEEQDVILRYPNSVTWSLTKSYGELIDSWTHLTNTTNLDLDGSLGELMKLLNFLNQLMFFQTDALGIIKYNENVALATNTGIPVELSNSGKVDGKVYFNTEIGCLNKDTIVMSKDAVYFIDGHTHTLYQLNSPLNLATPKPLSTNAFDTYLKTKNLNTAKSFYNREKSEVYFVFYSDNTSSYTTYSEYIPCLTYNELAELFTSFYEYIPDFAYSIGRHYVHILNGSTSPTLWKLNEGLYNMFYYSNSDNSLIISNQDASDLRAQSSPFYMTVVANGEDAMADKIFNNLEFRADTWTNNGKTLLNETFNYLKVWNEYQNGTLLLANPLSTHKPTFAVDRNTTRATLRKKFRIWRTIFPRALYNSSQIYINGIEGPYPNIQYLTLLTSISIPSVLKSRDRIRNPWTYVLLYMDKPGTNKTVLHDIVVYYYQ